jgi:quercetin dioxygenase-like cupin family protein
MVPKQAPPEPPEETVTPVFCHDIPNVDQRIMVALVVTYPPGGRSRVHRHAPSAFIYAHVLSGTVRSQVDDGPSRTFGPGEGFYEEPRSHHLVSENVSSTETASMLAIFIVDPKEENQLTIADGDGGVPSRSDEPGQEP